MAVDSFLWLGYSGNQIFKNPLSCMIAKSIGQKVKFMVGFECIEAVVAISLWRYLSDSDVMTNRFRNVWWILMYHYYALSFMPALLPKLDPAEHQWPWAPHHTLGCEITGSKTFIEFPMNSPIMVLVQQLGGLDFSHELVGDILPRLLSINSRFLYLTVS